MRWLQARPYPPDPPVHVQPKPGDCCVFCYYGRVKCPPKQSESCGHTV
ncbi:MAG: GDCCVxC domain-containing (seleno)protein [Thermodesulfobacteriota bacterium]